MNKVLRIIIANGFDVNKTEILEVIDNKIYIKCDNIKYELDGLNKKVISDNNINEIIHDKLPDDNIQSNSKKPKGWHLLAEYVDGDGSVYKKGKLVIS